MTDRITKILNTACVKKYLALYMSEREHNHDYSQNYIPQDNTKVSDSEDFDCVTIIENSAQNRAYVAFEQKYLNQFPNIRAGVIYCHKHLIL